MLAFGGVAAASATAEPGTPLWPITKLMWSDKADSKIAEQEAQRLLNEARQALATNRPQRAAELVTSAQPLIARVTRPAMRQRLQDEAAEILAQTREGNVEGAPARGQTGQPDGTAPGEGPTPAPGASPDPEKTGLLPPILPSPLPSLPLLP
jgi:hypothetical protein